MRDLCGAVRLVPRLRRSSLLELSRQRLPVVLAQYDSLCQRRSFSTGEDAGISRRQYISLYNYTPLDKKKLPKLRRDMREQWGDLDVVGRIYIAEEGINGQLVVPERAVNAFEHSFPRLLRDAKLFYGQLIPDKPRNPEELRPAEPFHKLDIRIRDQILHDGFQEGPLDLQEAGNSLPPDQWHQKLKERNELDDSNTLVLDVRNFYEHEIGRFDGATRIMVDTFRDTFEALDEILVKHEKEHDGQKPKEVMMYCTGGIRCEKVGAYLTQYKGISNVQKLHGGIVNYMRFLKDQRQAAVEARARSDDAVVEEISLFKGKNFVFDQRCVGELTEAEEVTDDVLGQCSQCGEPCNHHTNCNNVMCGGLILQCPSCANGFLGACSDSCKQEFIKMNAMTMKQQKEYRKQQATLWMPPIPNALSKHVSKRSRASLSRNLHTRHFTTSRTLNKSIDDTELQNKYVYDQSSVLTDDELLQNLREETARTWPKAEQLIDEMQGKFLSFLVETTRAQRVLEIGCFTGYSALCLADGLASDGSLVTCDIDAATMEFAQSFFDQSSHASQITAVNRDGLEYLSSIRDCQQFDFIFVDANKRKYRAYYDFILEQNLLHPSGLLVFDNTLFRGRVAAYAGGLSSSKERIARSLAEFNSYVARDPRTSQVVTPLWDGLTLVRLK
ncbi:hypothetical protein Pcac1_g10492 [Phytophthora cactorum]|uniref:Rhodanese domain-containing protein n=5 Tax=Phytophthora cactorum TaxID=29920 RepID=A0A329T2I1_9STRA|nr:hypothetical protein Pcac1_g10492 [Phytophthora cactorum]RAW43457.1 hypothetical protein PC110_g372 [Phytophthora cactorum]